jgi:hypothetical protein
VDEVLGGLDMGQFEAAVIRDGLPAAGKWLTGETLRVVQEKIVPRCATASCHAGEFPQAYPPLDADLAHGALVNAPSFQAPMDLVEPFDPANSYLVLKLRDVAGTVGSVGTPMPLGDALLEEADIQAIETWILNGAPND